MRQSEIIRFYSRRDVGEELARLAQGREIATQFRSGSYGKRPDIIQFPSEVSKLARLGATSFHSSEEHWSDPLRLSSEISPREMDNLRIGWDLLIDIDAPWFFVSTATAKLIIKALKFHGIKSISLKFSGNKGWHIGVSAKAFSTTFRNKPFSIWYPEAANIVSRYLMKFIAPHLEDEITELGGGDIKNISKLIGEDRSKFYDLKNKKFKPNIFSQIDAVLTSPRHLFRMPYSLHEKSWLVSLPIEPKHIIEFEKEWAKPEDIEVHNWFLKEGESGEATQLLVEAFDWRGREEEKKEVKEVKIEGKLGEKTFPPCIRTILQGLSDGKKRGVFILINFLKTLNWGIEEIEAKLDEWNKKNNPPLREGYIRAQLSWHKRHPVKIPPPNCDNMGYYKDIGVCRPDDLCKRIKNPLTYSARKSRSPNR